MIAIVTGGTRGFGLAFSNELIDKGFEVIKIASKKADYNFDLTTLNGTHKLIELIKEKKPSLVILNAGFGKTCKFENYIEKDIIDMQYINGTNKALVLNAFFKDIKNKKIKFIVTSSIAGKLPSPLMGAYSASKAYISNLIESLNAELYSQNIENLIKDWTPGNVNTKKQTEELQKYAKIVLNSIEWKIFNKDIYKNVIKKSQNNWKEFVKKSFDKKMERINARNN